MQILFLAFLTFALSGAHSALAPFIKPCKNNDNECIIKSTEIAIPYFTPGIPELGVPPTDPITLKEVNADQGDLKLVFTDLKIEGLSKCKIVDANKDYVNTVFTIKIACPVHGTGLYKLGGKFFVIPAEGEGEFEINTDEIIIEVKVNYKIITGKDGAAHWKITNFDYSFDLVKKVYFDLQNLFGGDETRAKPIKDLLDQSWKELIPELGQPIVKSFVTEVIGNVKKFFLAVPISELEL